MVLNIPKINYYVAVKLMVEKIPPIIQVYDDNNTCSYKSSEGLDVEMAECEPTSQSLRSLQLKFGL